MSDDFYEDAARARLAQLDAFRAQALADLAQHRANGDREAAAEVVQQIADTDAARANVLNLHQSYVRSQQRPGPEQISPEERQARPLDKMTYDDALETGGLATTCARGRSRYSHREIPPLSDSSPQSQT